MIAPGEASLVDEVMEEEEADDASLGDNDIVPGHLSRARVRRITHVADAWRGVDATRKSPSRAR